MGQAFDKDGQILGEMQADSMRKVLDGLQKRHPDAAEIRIKALQDRVTSPEDNQTAPAAPTRATDRMEQFFRFAHLPPHLQAVSKPFGELATQMIATLPSNPERTAALRKLLEAKDCAVRALLFEG